MTASIVFRWLPLLSGCFLVLFPQGGVALGDSLHRRLPQNASSSVISSKACSALNALRFEQQVLIVFQGQPGEVSNEDLILLQSSLIRAYNKVATCGNVAGALLRVSVVDVARGDVNSFGALIAATASSNVTQQFTLIATIEGNCRGCSMAPFRLLNYNSPSQRRRLGSRGLTTNNNDKRHLAALLPLSLPVPPLPTGPSNDKKKNPPIQVLPVLCNCPVPTKTSFIKAFNTLPSLPSGIESAVDINEIESYTPCSPTDTTFETLVTIDFTGMQTVPTNTNLQKQYDLIEQAVVQTYNNLNSLNLGDVCDPFFLTITNALIVAAPEIGFYGAVTFNVTGSCRGCSGNPPLLFNASSSGRRQLDEVRQKGDFTYPEQSRQPRHNAVDSDFTDSFLDSHPHRRMPVIAGGCYCPVSATEFRRPTKTEFAQALNARLLLLGSQGAGLITIADSVQDSFQDSPVNCSSALNHFEDTVAISYSSGSPNATANITQSEATALARSFAISYNQLAQQFCDPFFRTIEAVNLLQVVERRRLEKDSRPRDRNHRDLTKSNRTLSVTLTFSVRGKCRGCPSSTPLYNQVSGRRLSDIPATRESAVHAGVYSAQTSSVPDRDRLYRVLQTNSSLSSKCFCSVNSLGKRAPSFDEFLTAYNQTVASMNASTLTIAGGTAAATLSPSRSPTRTPSAPPSSLTPIRPPPTLATSAPTQKETPLTFQLPSTASPSKKPSIKPTRRPKKAPSLPPTIFPTLPFWPGITASPSQGIRPSIPFWPGITASPSQRIRPSIKPTVKPTNAPSAKPTNLPTEQPIVRQTLSPTGSPTAATPPPSNLPTIHPTRGPTAKPSRPKRTTNRPTQLPTVQPTPSPSQQPSFSPTQSPTQFPSLSPTFRSTPAPSARATSMTSQPPLTQDPPPIPNPTPSPSSPPTTKPTPTPTPLPTPQPTSLPTQQPSNHPPTSQPTPSPSRKPTPLPSLQPTTTPTPRPTPTPTAFPTPPPSLSPTRKPSASPSRNPTRPPSMQPTSTPTPRPTSPPTPSPTSRPSFEPTPLPTMKPTRTPTQQPTPPPTKAPTPKPTSPPTRSPTSSPTQKSTPRPSYYY